ncbi:arginine/serine-rich coiled-coil protein 2-like [Cuculus canorus]|uniref:arginine/serine-rich coiled-coil protein 2-like n=1 Tax=Cuculus canorus TaxID=55661 RepID=UPI0023AA70F9|nr:arginine/serine-rich coiled-coil protein 2-like [Cuculus canorus]
MASEQDVVEQSTSSAVASTSWATQAAVPDASAVLHCVICLDAISQEACVRPCQHRFCFPCIWDWGHQRTTCPLCRQTFHYVFRRLGPRSYEIYDIRRHVCGRRSQPRSDTRRRRRRSSSFSRRGQDGGHAAAPERARDNSPRRHHDGHGWAQRDRVSNSSRSQRQEWHQALDAARDHGRAPRPEQDDPMSSERSQRAGRHSSREQRVSRSRSRHRSRREQQPSRSRSRHRSRREQPALRSRSRHRSHREQRPSRSRSRNRSRREQRASRSRSRHRSRREQRPSRSRSRHRSRREQRASRGRSRHRFHREQRAWRSRSQHRSHREQLEWRSRSRHRSRRE